MYSPPALLTRAAIFEKFSEPRNLRGFIMMSFPDSSKNNMSSNSFGKIVLISVVDRIRVAGTVAVGTGAAEAGVALCAPVIFNCFEMSVKSSDMSFSIVNSWSILCTTSSVVGFFWVIQSPACCYFLVELPLLFCPRCWIIKHKRVML